MQYEEFSALLNSKMTQYQAYQDQKKLFHEIES